MNATLRRVMLLATPVLFVVASSLAPSGSTAGAPSASWPGSPSPRLHPQAITDCSNCHGDPSTGARRDLLAAHGWNCNVCHPSGDDSTILGPLGTWNRECSHCHNPLMLETGNHETPTNGHRCVVCHGDQVFDDSDDVHHKHQKDVNCVVCHGFVPDLGTAIASGNRDVCAVCHEPVDYRTPALSRDIHYRHVTEGLSCLECHAGGRPPIDVFPGPPVGSSVVVCDICHLEEDPQQFRVQRQYLHRIHLLRHLDCGACHKDAILQDDHHPMPPLDDVRRAMVSRQGLSECAHCHEDSRPGHIYVQHRVHVSQQGQWCFNCHEGDDRRPIGQAPPYTRPAEICELCHVSDGNHVDAQRYSDAWPFSVHLQHADHKCYSCHLGDPSLFDWPGVWLQRDRGDFTTYGSACAGSTTGEPLIGHQGVPLLGRRFLVTLDSAPIEAVAVLAIGLEQQSVDLIRVGMPNCWILTRPLTAIFTSTTAAGAASYEQTVPDDPDLVGRTTYYQWFVVDPPANQLGAIASEGACATVGR